MHRRIRSPSLGPNTLYVFDPQQNLGRRVFQRKIGFSPPPPPHTHAPHPVIFADHSNAVLLLWFILIVNVRPLSVCLFILSRIAWWPSPLGVLLLLFLYWAKVLTDHPKNRDNCFVFKYFETNFGTLNQNAVWHQSCASAGSWRSSCSLRMRIHIIPLKCTCNSRKDLNLNSNHEIVNNYVFASRWQ